MKFSKEQLEVLRRRFRLSPREIELVDLLFQGVSTNQDLAESLGITLGTTKMMLHTLYAKLACASKQQAIVRCLDYLRDVGGIHASLGKRREGPDDAGPSPQ